MAAQREGSSASGEHVASQSSKAKEHLAFVLLQYTLANAAGNRYFAERDLRHNPCKEEAFRYWTEHAAKRFRKWYEDLSEKERRLMCSVKSEEELQKLVQSGVLRDTVNWFS